MSSKKVMSELKTMTTEDSVKSNLNSMLSKNECKNATHSIYGKPMTAHQSLSDKDYEEYLRNGSRELVQQWDNTIEKIRQRKMIALKKKEEQKKAEGLYRFRH